jgi:hypothetical protein
MRAISKLKGKDIFFVFSLWYGYFVLKYNILLHLQQYVVEFACCSV